MITCKELKIELCINCDTGYNKYCLSKIWLDWFKFQSNDQIIKSLLQENFYQYNHFLSALKYYDKDLFEEYNKLRILI
jgi:hypothetical protein